VAWDGNDGGRAVVHRERGVFDLDRDDLVSVDAADLDPLAGDLDRALDADDPVDERPVRVGCRGGACGPGAAAGPRLSR